MTRGDRAGHVRAVPAARLERRRIAGTAFARVDPVARIAGVAVAAVAIVRDERVADEVVARQDVRGEIGVRAIARVDHRDHDARARGLVPGRGRVDAAGGFEVVPLLVVARVVRRERATHDAIGLGVFDVRIAGGDVARQLLGLGERQTAIGLAAPASRAPWCARGSWRRRSRAAGSSVPRNCAACAARRRGRGRGT